MKTSLTIVASATSAFAISAGSAMGATVFEFSSEPNDSFATASEADYSAGEDTFAGYLYSQYIGEGQYTQDIDYLLFTNLGAGPLTAAFSVTQFGCYSPCIVDLIFEFFDGDESLLGSLATTSIDGSQETDILGLNGLTPINEQLFVKVSYGDDEGFYESYSVVLDIAPTAIPLPASLPALALGIGALAALRRKQKRPAK